LFVTVNATRPRAGNVQRAFRALTRACRLPAGTGNNEPRLHDYADLRVMPTREEKPCSQGVIVATESA